jgi:type II restriction enzyme
VGKVDDCQKILVALGLPAAQHRRVAAYTLLALAELKKSTPWSVARRRSLRIHDIIGFLRIEYRKAYAENSRETIRRQVLHQLEQASVVDRNPDDPSLPTNSPHTHYAVSEAALKVLRSFGTSRFETEAAEFQTAQGSLLKVYQAARAKNLVPVKLPSGKEIKLSPGKHNKLQVAVIKEFSPRFAPGAQVLYLGDAAKKTLHLETAALKDLGVVLTEHDKLPDVVLYLDAKRWLYLIEAVTSHGPVSHKRKHELENFFAGCSVPRVYVSAFPTLTEFKRHVHDIAWETEVWISEIPDHLVHFNGDRFLGPH